MTGSWIACAVFMPLIAVIAYAAGWSSRRSRCFAHEVKSWQAGWDMGWEAARRLYEGEKK